MKCCQRLRLVWMLLLVAMLLLNAADAETIVVRHGSREEKKVAITLDDCYDRAHIASAVELCQTYGIPITFFPSARR